MINLLVLCLNYCCEKLLTVYLISLLSVLISHIDSTDYSPVNLELTFRGEPFQDTVAMFNITIVMDDIAEPVEEFYLNVIPDNNDVVLTPTITVRILDGE